MTNPVDYDVDVHNNEMCYFDIPYVTEIFVEKEIDEMSCKKATGPDGISCKILKIAKHIIVPSITKIIILSIKTYTFPSLWHEKLSIKDGLKSTKFAQAQILLS